jgi:hypothetical protein
MALQRAVEGFSQPERAEVIRLLKKLGKGAGGRSLSRRIEAHHA